MKSPKSFPLEAADATPGRYDAAFHYSHEGNGCAQFSRDSGLRLLFFGGKGGVGKTTCAAAAALRYASRSPQCSFLLVSTDPNHSLADSLGDFHPPHNLTVLEFSAQHSVDSFKEKHRGTFAEIAARGTFLDEEDIHRLLDLSLPGLDELMALLSIAGWAESQAYDLIVVDTAPTGHTLRLLTTPDLIRTWLKLRMPCWLSTASCGSVSGGHINETNWTNFCWIWPPR